jgi:hypothetical protein
MSMGGGSSQPSSTTQIQQLPKAARPFLYGGEDYAGLLPQAYELSQQPMQRPDYMVAGRTPTQVAAETMARQARGSYEPALAAGEALTGQGVMATEQAGRLSQQELGAAQGERAAARAAMASGLGALQGTGEEYDPTAVQGYMNPYEQQAIDAALGDIARQGQMQLNEARAQAVRSGAFGGARSGLAESEVGRNILSQQASTAANMRQQGFESAAQRSQEAFEQAQQRQIAGSGQAAQIGSAVGALGTDYGQLGQQAAGQQAQFGQGLGALGAQMAGFGQQRQGQQLQDINTALTLGQQQQAQEQAYLDAARQNQYQATMAPYQQLGFFSDIFQGAPTGTSAVVQQQQPGPNPLGQAVGLGLAGVGLFGEGGPFSGQ